MFGLGVSAAADGYFYIKNNTASTGRFTIDFEPTQAW